MEDIITEKKCSKCGVEKPITEFYKNKLGKYGVRSYCKICELLWGDKWRKNHPERAKEIQKNYKKNNPEKYKASQKKYRDTHKEEIHQRFVEYKAGHPEVVRDNHIRSRYGISIDDYNKIFIKQDGRCAICGENQSERLAIDHDHITGEIRGLLCRKCNLMLGYSGDNPGILRSAASYIELHDTKPIKD